MGLSAFADGDVPIVSENDLVVAKESLSRWKHELIDLQTKRNLAAALVSATPFSALDSNEQVGK